MGLSWLLAAAALAWRYDVVEAPEGRELAVTAELGEATAGPLVVATSTQRFVRRRPGKGRYVFDLAEAAKQVADPDRVARFHAVFVTNPATWLPHPETGSESQTVLIHVTPTKGHTFATGLFPASEPNTYRVTADRLDSLPLSVFGPLSRHVVAMPGGSVEVVHPLVTLPVGDAVLVDAVTAAAKAVSTYYGRLPVPHVLIYVRPGRAGTGGAVTFGSGGATIILPLGDDVTPALLKKDWVLTHELVHTALPSLPPAQHWLEEGLATYVEPLARLRAGQLTAERVLKEMVESLPQGEPEAGDRGLDRTPTWGRTYWGGALFCFVADVRLRERTKGRLGLEDALRGVLAAGGTIADDWEIGEVLAAADKATGQTVLRELYEEMKEKPAPVDLDGMWKRLGVTVVGGAVRLDDRAPGAGVRRAIFGR